MLPELGTDCRTVRTASSSESDVNDWESANIKNSRIFNTDNHQPPYRMSTAHAQLNTNNQSPHSTAHHCSHIQLCISDERVKIFPHHQIVFEIFDPIESLFYFSIWSDWPPLSAEKIGLSLSHIVPSIFSLICDPVEFGEVPPSPPNPALSSWWNHSVLYHLWLYMAKAALTRKKCQRSTQLHINVGYTTVQ